MDDGGAPLWTTIVFALLSLYGAVLSSWEFISRRNESKPRIKVEPTLGFLPTEVGIGPTMLLIQVSNAGRRTVHIQAPQLVLPDGRRLVFMTPQSNVDFPHRFEEGTNCYTWMPIGELARQLTEEGLSGKVTLRTSCKDQVGNEYPGGKIEIDIEDWMQRE